MIEYYVFKNGEKEEKAYKTYQEAIFHTAFMEKQNDELGLKDKYEIKDNNGKILKKPYSQYGLTNIPLNKE